MSLLKVPEPAAALIPSAIYRLLFRGADISSLANGVPKLRLGPTDSNHEGSSPCRLPIRSCASVDLPSARCPLRDTAWDECVFWRISLR
jgi:hypothetical protein